MITGSCLYNCEYDAFEKYELKVMQHPNRTVIVTGGAGYVGSHVVIKLHEAGYIPLILDNFFNSSKSVIGGIEAITGTKIEAVKLDVRDAAGLASLFARTQPFAVIHCAGLKAVAESVQKPLLYFEQNICGTVNLLKQMEATGCRRIVFSSSATVYGHMVEALLREDTETSPLNPYGRTKLFIEEIIRDWCAVEEKRSAVLLRYFNPIGADASGLIGESPKNIPNNLMPLILQVAAGNCEKLSVYGNDYQTPDGTGVRDYVHIDDLARGHVAAVDFTKRSNDVSVFNLGTGVGVSVLELIASFERVTGQHVPYGIVPRRPGDMPICVADPSRARDSLGWKTIWDLDRMCADAWRFQKNYLAGIKD